VQATAALYPFLDALGLGLRQMVNVNVVKLERQEADARSAPPVERLVEAEVARGAFHADDGVAVAVLWNGRILRLCEKLIGDARAGA